MKRKIQLLSIIIILALSLSGCSMNTGAKVYDDEEMIAKNYNTYNLVMSKQSVKENVLSGSANLMEGMGTIWKYNAKEPTDVTITYQIKITSGKAKLVLIAPDDSITTLVECTPDSDMEQTTSNTFQIEKGQNRIKLIGAKDTEIDYEITSDKGKMKSFGD